MRQGGRYRGSLDNFGIPLSVRSDALSSGIGMRKLGKEPHSREVALFGGLRMTEAGRLFPMFPVPLRAQLLQCAAPRAASR